MVDIGEIKVGQKIKVKSLDELKELHGCDWDDLGLYSIGFLERNAGKIRTIKNIDMDHEEIYIEEDDGDFLIKEEIRPLVSIDIPKEMFEL